MEPDVFEKLLWGGSVVGLRVRLRKAKRPIVARLLQKAWMRKAPKVLTAKLQAFLGT